MNKFFIFLISSLALFSLANSVMASAVVISNPLSATSIGDLLEKIIDAVAILVGSISVIMIIVAGIMYLLSAGNPQKMATAQKALTYAIIGLAVAVIASTIVDIVKEILGVQSNVSGGAH